MADEHELQRRIAELESTVRMIQDENADLADRAEDMFLLALIAEEIAVGETPSEVLDRGLERISILKDIPYCAAYWAEGDSTLLMSSFYSRGQTADRGCRSELPCTSEQTAGLDTVYLTGEECERFDPGLPCGVRFRPQTMMLIPMASQSGDRFVLMFADDRADERLPAMTIMLHRAADMMRTKIDNLELLASLREVNAALEATNQTLTHATRAKSEFLANMSHEIRTPMNAILGYAQLLRRSPGLNDQQRERLDIINRSGEYLLSLINDVLEMSKIEAGRTTATLSTFGLRTMLEEIDDIFRARAQAKGIELIVDYTDDLPHLVITDKAKLRQILVNLLSNAFKFTTEGHVHVRVSAQRLSPDSTQLLFEVEDTGAGIAPEEIGLLFRQFEQTASGRSLGSGTGLGLTISREYTKLLGGDIRVESTEGTGTTFTFDVHVGTAKVVDAEPELGRSALPHSLAPGQPTYKVLVADDHKEMRKLVVDILEGLGFEVQGVTDGQQAVEAFSAWRPQLIIMDMRMPVMSGAEAIKTVRASEGGDDVKIIALTASAFTEAKELLLASGADAYMSKPFTHEQLVEVLTRLLGAQFVALGPIKPAAPSGISAPADAPRLQEELVARLRAAAEMGDFDQVLALVTRIEDRHPVLADRLRTACSGYDALAILTLLKQ